MTRSRILLAAYRLKNNTAGTFDKEKKLPLSEMYENCPYLWGISFLCDALASFVEQEYADGKRIKIFLENSQKFIELKLEGMLDLDKKENVLDRERYLGQMDAVKELIKVCEVH